MMIKELEITKQMVDDFRIATQDLNKIHEGEKAIALGFQLAAILYARARETLSTDLYWTSQTTKFERPVKIGSKVRFECDLAGQEGDTFEITAKLIDAKDNFPVAVSTLLYGPSKPAEHTAPEGKRHVIKREDAEKTARGIGIQGIDISALVRGLASDALYTDGKGVIHAAATEKGLFPVYRRHEILPTPAERELQIGSVIYIATNASAVAKKITRDLREGKDIKKRPYTADVKAVTEGGITVYDGRLTLLLMKKEDFDKQIA